jgi:DNA-binding PadR family transcriptional regulator
MPPTRALTELEGCVLGLVWANGPCTPYAVRKVFLSSKSPHWSGSAGAIYPLVERLAGLGLLGSEAHATGRRASLRYVVTAEGVRALVGWLGPSWPDWVAGVPPDPLRTRLRFLAALPPAQQRQFLLDAEELVREHRDRLQDEADRRRGEDFYRYMNVRGAVLVMTARLEWLREFRLALANSAGAS